MRNVFLIGSILSVAILLVWFVVTLFNKELISSEQPSGVTSLVEQAQTTMTISNKDGLDLRVKNFIENGVTQAVPSYEGRYVMYGGLGFCLDENDSACSVKFDDTSFHIQYFAEDDLFRVELHEPPYRQARLNAEAFLSSALGTTPQQLCILNSEVVIQGWASQRYSRDEMGFSNCPGSIQFGNEI